jgi:hypothetical protein
MRNFAKWLVPETAVADLWTRRFQLYRCPCCSALWVRRSECQGHQDWYDSFERIDSLSSYQSLLSDEEEKMNKRLAELKATYEKNGWQWKW